jgi:hypothetical protein
MLVNMELELISSFRGTPSEPELAFDETAKAIAMNGVSHATNPLFDSTDR